MIYRPWFFALMLCFLISVVQYHEKAFAKDLSSFDLIQHNARAIRDINKTGDDDSLRCVQAAFANALGFAYPMLPAERTWEALKAMMPNLPTAIEDIINLVCINKDEKRIECPVRSEFKKINVTNNPRLINWIIGRLLGNEVVLMLYKWKDENGNFGHHILTVYGYKIRKGKLYFKIADSDDEIKGTLWKQALTYQNVDILIYRGESKQIVEAWSLPIYN